MSRWIDADVLTEVLLEIKREYLARDIDNVARGIAVACTIVENAPSSDATERKHGEWKERETFCVTDDPIITEWQSARCSTCGKYHTTPYMYYFTNFNYCPNCGADMRGAEE